MYTVPPKVALRALYKNQNMGLLETVDNQGSLKFWTPLWLTTAYAGRIILCLCFVLCEH